MDLLVRQIPLSQRLVVSCILYAGLFSDIEGGVVIDPHPNPLPCGERAGVRGKVIRFMNREVFNQLEDVVQRIAEECQRLIPPSP
jgi:hypothetical protein